MTMILGKGKKQSGTNEGKTIFDVTIDTFENDVLKASLNTPILIDFWAPWCGPCKQLMPVLEKVVSSYGGKIKLAKVDIDSNPELAQAFQVQSVPTVIAVAGGQPVTGFQGAQPESQIKSICDQLIQMGSGANPENTQGPQEFDAEAYHEKAESALNEGDLPTAQALYAALLQNDDKDAKAFAGLLKVFMKAGQADQARSLYETAPPEIKGDKALKSIKDTLEMMENAPSKDEQDALRKKVEKQPDNHQAHYDLSMSLFANGQEDEAVEEMLSLFAKKRDWEDEKAKKQLLKFFESLGDAHSATIKGRKKLSSILFS